MKLFKLIKLGHADFAAQRKVVTISVIAASIPLMILMGLNLMISGLENVLLRESAPPTDGKVVLVLNASSSNTRLGQQVDECGGEVIGKLNLDDAEKYPTTADYIAKLANVDRNKVTMGAGRSLIDNSSEKFHPIDLFLSGIYSYQPSDYYQQALEQTAHGESQLLLVRFPDPATAYKYYRLTIEQNQRVSITEPFSNLLNIYTTFENAMSGIQIFQLIFLIVAVVIVVATYVYLLDQNFHSMIVYRAMGSTTLDLLVISLTYLVEVGVCILISALAGGIALAIIASWLSAEHLTGVMTSFYDYAPTSVLLLGFSMNVIWLKVAVLVASPISLILMLDQFSMNNMMKKLKHDQTMLQ